MNRARRHHYIPEFHLAQFIGEPFRRFHVYDKKWGKFAIRPVATSATAEDYYLLAGATVLERLTLERQFALLEDRVAPVLKWLSRCEPGAVSLSDEDRDAIAGYMALLHTRVPAYRSPAQARAIAMARDPEYLGLADPTAFRVEFRALGFSGTDEQAEATRLKWLANFEAGRIAVTPLAQISLLALTPAVEKVRPILFSRRWELLRTGEWPGLVIGDQPVTLLSSQGLAGSAGFGNQGAQVMMPLSPTTALYITDAPRERSLEVKEQPTKQSLREPWWARLNRIAWLTSSRYVVARRLGDLQATELLIDPADRRRDIRVLDPATEARVMERVRERSRARRAGRSNR
jgi:hypothetical protein